jgi:dynein heavy chain, axonemal
LTPTAFEQLMVPRFNVLEQALTPGCLTLTWVSPNIEEYCQNVFKELENLDLVLRRANDLVTYRIEAVLNDMSNLVLCEINDEEPISADDFLEKTNDLCTHGALMLQSKSHNIEEATEELIELLYPEYKNNIDMENEDEEDNNADLEETRNSHNALRNNHEGSTNKSESKLAVTQEARAARKRREARIAMQETANELFNYFNHKNVDAIIKLVRTTLERLRKRINSSQTLLRFVDSKEKLKKEIPVFKCFAILAIPNIAMQPTLDEVQQMLNKAVQSVINVSKNVTQWTKGRKTLKKKDQSRRETVANIDTGVAGGDLAAADPNGENGLERPGSPANSTMVVQKNYLKAVSENKDISKMISLLSTCISSMKKDVLTAIDRFKEYQFIWEKDREEDLKEFLQQEPRVSEFEAKIRAFQQLSIEINSKPEYESIGAIALVTEMLKLGLTSEIHLWKTCYGEACNKKYKKEINEISVFIEESFKKLQREIKDLDDIRLAMAALKDLRDNEIRIDMTILPIEECYAMLQKHEIEVPREEIERCDTLRYNWQKLLQLSSQTSSNLLEIQPLYKDGLKNDVKEFVKQCDKFYSDYNKVSLFYFISFLIFKSKFNFKKSS